MPGLQPNPSSESTSESSSQVETAEKPPNQLEVSADANADDQSSLDKTASGGNEEKGGDPGGEKPPKADNFLKKIKRFPAGVFFMLGNELCERFSFYGMRAILTLYLLSVHHYTSSTAESIYHGFVALCYFAPILGSVLSDGYFGRYKVILWGSLLYCVGHILLTSSAAPKEGSIAVSVLDFSGLALIAIATGTIKPCVSAFAADQFPPNLVKERQSFFSIFYFAINFGSFVSIILTPILRQQPCQGKENCFPLAFGVPAGLMLTATAIFIAGKCFYVIEKHSGNIIGRVFKMIGHAIKMRGKRKKTDPKREHWLEYADDQYDKVLIQDVRRLLKVFILFIPIPLFWGLFDQQGSTWVIQASNMDGHIGKLTVAPDQMSTVNPILILLLIPIFESCLYPLLTKFRFMHTPLKKMAAGGVFAALAFVIAGFLELKVKQSYVDYPDAGNSRIFVRNNLDCGLAVNLPDGSLTVPARSEMRFNLSQFPTFETDKGCSMTGKPVMSGFNVSEFKPDPGKAFFVTANEPTKGSASVFVGDFKLTKSKTSKATFMFFVGGALTPLLTNESAIHMKQKGRETIKQSLESGFANIVVAPAIYSTKEYDITLVYGNGKQLTIAEKFRLETSTLQAFTVWDTKEGAVSTTIIVPKSQIKILWQVPQYIVITVGELFLSVTGLEFSYTQAPPSMRSVLQGAWLLTVAFGNCFDMVITGSNAIKEPYQQFFFYAGLMVAVMLVFALLSRKYEYNQESTNEHELGGVVAPKPGVAEKRYEDLDEEKGAEKAKGSEKQD